MFFVRCVRLIHSPCLFFLIPITVSYKHLTLPTKLEV